MPGDGPRLAESLHDAGVAGICYLPVVTGVLALAGESPCVG